MTGVLAGTGVFVAVGFGVFVGCGVFVAVGSGVLVGSGVFVAVGSASLVWVSLKAIWVCAAAVDC